jgi:hypothetical protein
MGGINGIVWHGDNLREEGILLNRKAGNIMIDAGFGCQFLDFDLTGVFDFCFPLAGAVGLEDFFPALVFRPPFSMKL